MIVPRSRIIVYGREEKGGSGGRKGGGCPVFRLDALALSVIAMATWLAGWVQAGCLSQPVLYQNDKTYRKTFWTIW